MRHRKYGLAADDWYADYDDKTTYNFGSQWPDSAAKEQCLLTAKTLISVLGRVNGIQYFSDELAPMKEYRWMSHNYKWSNGQKLPPESNDWQNPRSFYFSSNCSNILNAFYKDTTTAQLSGRLASHSELPITIVRGGNISPEWNDAQLAANSVEAIISNSRTAQNARLNSVAAFYSAVGNKIKDAFASAADSGSEPVVGQFYQCKYQCRKAGVLGYLNGAPAGSFDIKANSDADADSIGRKRVGDNGANVCQGQWYLHNLECKRK